MDTEVMVQHLRKYFSKSKNIDYIIKKIKGPDQTIKLYEILCMLNNPNEDTCNFTDTINFIKNDTLLWSHPTFDKERKKIEEEDDFYLCPRELCESVLRCKKCGCSKVYSYSKQTRSLDEPTTVFAMCSKCSNKWSE